MCNQTHPHFLAVFSKRPNNKLIFVHDIFDRFAIAAHIYSRDLLLILKTVISPYCFNVTYDSFPINSDMVSTLQAHCVTY